MAAEDVLVVDDNPANVKLITFILASHGYVVRTAADADEALGQLERQRPDLILMDVQLPGMDGLTLTQKLRQDPANRDLVIIAVTAHAMRGDQEKALAAGCDGFIAKPIDTRRFPDEIAEHLARLAERRSAR